MIAMRDLYFFQRAFWVANYQDERNYVEFEIDERNITMSIIADGKTTEGKPFPHPLVKYDNYYTLSIQVAPNRVVFGGFKNGNYIRTRWCSYSLLQFIEI